MILRIDAICKQIKCRHRRLSRHADDPSNDSDYECCLGPVPEHLKDWELQEWLPKECDHLESHLVAQ